MGNLLPSPHQLLGAGGMALCCLLFLLLGNLAARRSAPEMRLLAGWGVACLVLTAWGALTGLDLGYALAALVLAALAGLAHPATRRPPGGWAGIGRILLLAIPLIAVLLPMAPSQVDTWLNLLPNAAFLADHHRFPANGLAESWSFIPVAPYNTQLVAYIASIATGSFAESAMSQFNVVLLLAGGLALARALAGRADLEAPPFWALAAAMLIALPLNPGFAPRDALSPYGETGLAVTVFAAVLLASRATRRLALAGAMGGAMDSDMRGNIGGEMGGDAAALAWVLVAMVNVKQSAIGLVLGLAGAWAIALLIARPAHRRKALLDWMLALVPALALYLLWRWYVATHMPNGELEALPFAAWNWSILPGILLGVFKQIITRPLLYILSLFVIIAGARAWRRTGREGAATICVIAGLLCLAQTGFLIFTYIAHFDPGWALDAHSFFRYFSQCSLAILLGLIVILRPWGAAKLARLSPRPRRRIAAATIVLALLGPALAWPALRVDHDSPQPQLAAFLTAAKPDITPQDRIGLLLPGVPDDSAGSFFRGVILFLPPRLRPASFATEPAADPAALARLRRQGATLALVSCAPDGLDGIPPGQGGLLRWTGTEWRMLRHVSWPRRMRRQHFAGLLPPSILCMQRSTKHG